MKSFVTHAATPAPGVVLARYSPNFGVFRKETWTSQNVMSKFSQVYQEQSVN